MMLYFGDFDPSGLEMLEAMKITLRNELDIDNIEFKREVYPTFLEQKINFSLLESYF